jgi:hypothetical protein
MGGKAFLQSLPIAAFPRMSTPIYNKLKAQLLPCIEALYAHVKVPPEAPGKPDHGDLDFLVACPRRLNVAPADVCASLGASASIPMEGNRTSHFAVPFATYGLSQENLGLAEAITLDGKNLCFQVDVHVCEDVEELAATNFVHSYSDLGMILGVIARGVGLHLGTKGLKVRSCKTAHDAFSFRLFRSIPFVACILRLLLAFAH